jgi:hypothetical protein
MGQPKLVQNSVQAKSLPELVTDVHRAGLAMMLGAHTAWIDGNVPIARCQARPPLRRANDPRIPSVADLIDVIVEAAAAVEQIILAEQRMLELPCTLEPLLGRSGTQITERTDGSLPRPVGRAH